MTHAPGIYFGMPEAEYHADQSLSNSGIKDLLISPLDFWVWSWMNDSRPDDPDSKAKALGRAYHRLILEGDDAFRASYAIPPSKSDYPEALATQKDMKAWLKAEGVKGYSTKSGDELVAMIRERDAVVEIWPEIEAEWLEKNGDKETITVEQWTQLKLAAYVVSRTAHAREAVTGGYPEVSLFWRHESGIPMKARIDYLKPKTIVDLKSFGNVMSKPIMQAVTGEITRCKYQFQPVIYCDGLKAIKALYKKQGADVVYGDVDPDWLDVTLRAQRERFTFLFVQTGPAPNIVLREFSEFETWADNGGTANIYWSDAADDVKTAIQIYRRCMEEYGETAPWVADFGFRSLVDGDFPPWHFNQKQELAQ